MPLIHLTTFIAAPVEIVFDLSRSMTLHAKSMQHTNEKAIAGVSSGLINLNETVTWQAKHLFKTRILQSKITAMTPYSYFKDETVNGDFKSMKHDHYFKPVDNGTIMIDKFQFESPSGSFGRFFNFIISYKLSHSSFRKKKCYCEGLC